MNLVRLDTLRTAARNRSNTLVDQNVTDPEVTGMVNDSIGEFYDILVMANEDYILKQWPIATASGTSTYGLAPDHYVTRGVDAQLQAGSQPVTVNRFDFEDRNKYGYVPLPVAGVSPQAASFMYKEENNTIVLIPGNVLASGIPLNVWYYPVPAPLAADSDTFDFVALGWNDYVAVDVAIKIKDKQESDCTVLMAQKEALKQRIRARAGRRNQTQPHRMVSSLRGGRMLGRLR